MGNPYYYINYLPYEFILSLILFFKLFVHSEKNDLLAPCLSSILKANYQDLLKYNTKLFLNLQVEPFYI